jgi:L-rhamnose 1-dehydrogenase
MTLLADKIVCITGSSRGIGRACAVESAKHGATGLILHYFGDQETEAELQSLKEEIYVTTHNHCQVVSVPGDIADSETSQKVRTWIMNDQFSRHPQ